MGKTFATLVLMGLIVWGAWTYMPLLDPAHRGVSGYSSAPAPVLPTITDPGRGPVKISDALDPILRMIFTSLVPNGAVVMGERPRIAAMRSEIEVLPTSPAQAGEIRASGLRVCAFLQQAIDETASADARKRDNFFAPSDSALSKTWDRVV